MLIVRNILKHMQRLYSKIDHRANINSFHLAREILRQNCKYNVKIVKGHDLVKNAKQHKNEVLFVLLQPENAVVTRVVCITKNQFDDGTFSYKLKCNAESLRWLCSKSDHSLMVISSKIEIKCETSVSKETNEVGNNCLYIFTYL